MVVRVSIRVGRRRQTRALTAITASTIGQVEGAEKPQKHPHGEQHPEVDSPPPGRRRSWLLRLAVLYHRGLQEAARDLFSAGRASAILARMQRAGLIVSADAFQRGRQRRYVPAPAMVEAFRACYRIELESLALIDPRVAPMVEGFDRSDVFDRIVAFLASRHLAAPALDQELIDPLGGVGRRSMGLMCAYALAEAAFADGRTSPEGVVAINTSALARRLGVSRTHVRRVLATLKNAGLIADGPSSDRLILTPGFAEGYRLYFYGMFSVLLAAVGCLDG